MSDSPRRWLPLRIRTLLLLILLAVVSLSVYSYWSDYVDQSLRRERELLSPPRGARCTVIFRRDLLGIDRMHPAPATVADPPNSVEGPFMLMNDQWIVLDASPGHPQQWIPRDHVLLLQVESR